MVRPSTPGLIRGQVCRQGHDDWVLRKSGKWVCKPCKRANVELNRRLAEEDEMKPKVTVDKLAAEVERRLETGRQVRRQSGGRVQFGPTSERALFGAVNSDSAAFKAWRRAKMRGLITLDALDDLCVYLDCHPREIYGDEYDEAAAPGGLLEPDFYRTDWVPRDIVKAVRVALDRTDEEPWWWHVGRHRSPLRATARF